MAFSKHAHYRYNILDHCFRELNLSFKELKTHLNRKLEVAYNGEQITERQLGYDLKVFRRKEDGFNAPLPLHIRNYRYTDPNFSIAQRPLLEYEKYLVDAAARLLERFENHDKYSKLAEALVRFQEIENIESDDLGKILYYDHNEEYKGIRWLKPLYHAIKKKQVLKVKTKMFNKDESEIFEFHPYLLKQYNRRWFVFGYNPAKKEPKWSIPLDKRLEDIFEIEEEVQYIESETDWEDHFNSIVGIVTPRNKKMQRVVLKFHNETRMEHFTTKPFIATYEEFFEEEKNDQVWFDCFINRELVQQILSYGSDVEVLEPESLREKMKEHSDKLFNFYK